MRRALAFSIVLKAALSASGASAETLKVAVAQRGFWNSSFIEFGIKQGFFKETGLDIDILYTEGGASTLTPVIAGSIDIAMTNGTLGAIAAYAKGMPVKIISAEATGAPDAFWYARPESGITTLADTAGRTVAFSSPGSSTNLILLQLIQQAKVTPKMVATGGAPGTLTQVMSGQIDIGWAAAPFGLDQVDNTIRIVARGSDVAATRQLTTRVLIAHAETLAQNKATIAKFLAAYRETIDWMYAGPEAIKIFAEFAGVSESAAKRARDEFFTKAALDPGTVTGLPEMMADGVQFKFLQAPLTQDQLAQIVQIGGKIP